MYKTTITLTHQPEIDNNAERFLRNRTEDGTEMATGWNTEDGYYWAPAVDAEDNEYRVYWVLVDDYDPEYHDETDCCDWNNPVMVLKDDIYNVTGQVDIVM